MGHAQWVVGRFNGSLGNGSLYWPIACFVVGARQLQPTTTATAANDSIPPLRIARPQHLQASHIVINGNEN